MSLLNGLFANKSMQNAALGMIKKSMSENNVKFILLNMKPDGDLSVSMYAAQDEPVIISQKQLDQMRAIAAEYERICLQNPDPIEPLNPDQLTLNISENDSNQQSV